MAIQNKSLDSSSRDLLPDILKNRPRVISQTIRETNITESDKINDRQKQSTTPESRLRYRPMLSVDAGRDVPLSRALINLRLSQKGRRKRSL